MDKTWKKHINYMSFEGFFLCLPCLNDVWMSGDAQNANCWIFFSHHQWDLGRLTFLNFDLGDEWWNLGLHELKVLPDENLGREAWLLYTPKSWSFEYFSQYLTPLDFRFLLDNIKPGLTIPWLTDWRGSVCRGTYHYSWNPLINKLGGFNPIPQKY